MQILQVYSGQNSCTGDFIYRIAMPQQGLASLDGVDIINADLLELTDYDVLLTPSLLVLHHLTDPDLLPVVTRRKQLGLVTIYELADNCRHSRQVPPAGQNGSDYNSIVEELMRRCDAVQTTSPGLKGEFASLNPEFFVFPNLVIQANPAPHKKSDFITIGWGGSARHFDDLEPLRDALLDWVGSHPEVRLAIMGSHRIQSLFRNKLPDAQLSLRGPGSLSDYYTFLHTLDIGIAPLQPTGFNAGRSDVKYLEYASHAVVPVCSDSEPYATIGGHGQRILLFGDAAELIDTLEYLRVRPSERQRITESALLWVQKNRLANRSHWQDRLRAYQNLKENEYDWDGGTIPRHSIDQILGAKLNHGIAMRDQQKAATFLEHLFFEYADNFQAGYFYGWALSRLGLYAKAIEVLCFALALRPRSIRIASLLIQAAILNDETELACKILEGALKTEPNLSVLIELRQQLDRIEGLKKDTPSVELSA